jgi:hypothetical protein
MSVNGTDETGVRVRSDGWAASSGQSALATERSDFW